MARRKSSRGRVFYYPSSLPKMQDGAQIINEDTVPIKVDVANDNPDSDKIITKKGVSFSEAGTRYVEKDPATGLPKLKSGGIPERYKNKGFTKVGAKKQSTRPGKKWMVLAKKGDDYKVVHGGYKGMKDFSQHGSKDRKEKFWSRMGGKNSSKAQDPFSPLYWHKRFGTWEYGGDIQQQGYKDNSPYRNRRYIDIYSNNITMDGVSQPLRVKTDRGEERILEPNSGEYYFPGANVVREMPLRDTPLYFSPSSKGLTKYQTGGFLPMYEEGGDVSEENVTEENVSDATIDEYIETLMQQENAAMKGYDAEKGLWFPHDAPEEGGGKDIGYGHKIKSDEDFSEGLTDAQVRSLLASDLTEKMDSAARKFNNKSYDRTWDDLSTEEQILLTDYEYNVGLTKFPKLMKAVAEQDIETMLSQYKRYSDGKPLTSRNNWTKGFIEDKIKRVPANLEEETIETLKTTPIDNKVTPNVILNTFPQGQTQNLETKSSEAIPNPVQSTYSLEKVTQAPYPIREEQLGTLDERQYTLDNIVSPVVGNPFKGKDNYSRTRGPGEKGSGLYDTEGKKYSLVDYYDKKTGKKVGTYNPMTNQVIDEYQTGGKLPKAQFGIPTTADSLALYNNAIEKSKFYKNNPDYRDGTPNTDNSDIAYIFDEVVNNADMYNNSASDFYANTANRSSYNTIYGSPEERFKVINPNMVQLGDILTGLPNSWYNNSAPPILLHNIIEPKRWIRYNSLDDRTDIPYYDPVEIYPKSLGEVPKEAYKYSDIPYVKSAPSPGNLKSVKSVPSASTSKSVKSAPSSSVTPSVNYNTDLVAYLQKVGKPFDYNTRKDLAKQYGIDNYKGTAAQNIELLNLIKKGPLPVREKEELGTLPQREVNSNVILNPFEKEGTYRRSRQPGEKGSALYDELGKQYQLEDYYTKDGKKIGTYDPVKNKIVEKYQSGGQLPKAEVMTDPATGLPKLKKGGKAWIQGAIKKPGALKATAKREGAIKSDGTIKKSWLREKARGKGKTAQRARLAITLGKMRK